MNLVQCKLCFDSLSVCISSSSSSSSSEEALSLVDSLVHLVTSRCSTSLSVPIESEGQEAIHKIEYMSIGFQAKHVYGGLSSASYHSPRLQAVAQGSLSSATMAVSTLCCQMRDAEGETKRRSALEVLTDAISALREKVSSTFATEYASIMSNVFCSRASNIVSSASLTSTDDCMALLTEAIKSSHPSVAKCLELTVSSAFCWASGIGPSDALAATIIEGLKCLAKDLDQDSYPSIEMVARKTRGRTGTKDKGHQKRESQKEEPLNKCTNDDDEDRSKPLLQVQQAALLVHIWVVLAQWSLPSSLASEDHLASDGMVGQHIYLSNAMKALHNLANGLQKIVDLSNYTNRGCKLAAAHWWQALHMLTGTNPYG